MLHLEHSATLLQKIHFPEYMKGYRLFLHVNGTWSSRSTDAMASLFVSLDGIELTVFSAKVSTTIQVEIDTPIKIDGSVQLLYRNWTYTLSIYTDAPSWWPYVGKITIPPLLNRYQFNDELHIGRKSGIDIELPSDGHCENIFWIDGLTKVDTIPTPSGVIPKNRFATDMINVSSHHGTFSLLDSNVLLKCESNQCPIFINRKSETVILSPNAPNATGVSAILKVGDEIFIGNHCFYVMRLPDDTFKSDDKIDSVKENELLAEMTDFSVFGTSKEPDEVRIAPPKDPTPKPSAKTIFIAEQDWELSLHSPSRIKIHGWVLKGEMEIGNHINCGICIPENQTIPQQTFPPTVYAFAHIRGGKGHIEVLTPAEFECHNPDSSLLEQQYSVARRSPSGNVDFNIPITLSDDCPVPGAILFKLAHTDPTVSSMFHLSIIENLPQVIQLCQYTCTAKINDGMLTMIAPTEIRLMKEVEQKWQICSDPSITLKPNGFAILGSLLIQFIHDAAASA
ncbi:MAG: hypothetical protein ACON4U_03865 [Myxococcota bacterium]